ncbi:hypothetical protein DPEC_G00339140 [Dallia pectoralis]|uniref:Uncharacterized protein n=1 Tax=Dallia pectoralis TaxID=75939 RepID=A0ACC2F4Q3_DALPE|nr:hypothetical protein DPEC_G00339140 [Dallia pectoralis]
MGEHKRRKKWRVLPTVQAQRTKLWDVVQTHLEHAQRTEQADIPLRKQPGEKRCLQVACSPCLGQDSPTITEQRKHEYTLLDRLMFSNLPFNREGLKGSVEMLRNTPRSGHPGSHVCLASRPENTPGPHHLRADHSRSVSDGAAPTARRDT